MVLKDEIARNDFLKFLLSQESLNARNLDLFINSLCQTGFAETALLDKLEKNESFSSIAKIYKNSTLSSELPGYYNLSNNQILMIADKPHIIEQISLRVISERRGMYSVALNHLLNEIHAICCSLEGKQHENYKAEQAVKFLGSKRIPHEDNVNIRNLFDRRNRNSVSHPGSEDSPAWGVTSEEYYQYYNSVGKCLGVIL